MRFVNAASAAALIILTAACGGTEATPLVEVSTDGQGGLTCSATLFSGELGYTVDTESLTLAPGTTFAERFTRTSDSEGIVGTWTAQSTRSALGAVVLERRLVIDEDSMQLNAACRAGDARTEMLLSAAIDMKTNSIEILESQSKETPIPNPSR
ncbi:MAG: hypothetical protein AAF658_21575 [Myxococcota bacterium]